MCISHPVQVGMPVNSAQPLAIENCGMNPIAVFSAMMDVTTNVAMPLPRNALLNEVMDLLESIMVMNGPSAAWF
jgi:hypothetical protein